jgi:hypothetical protein
MYEVLSGIESSWIVPEGDSPWQQTSRIAMAQIPVSTALRARPDGTIGLRLLGIAIDYERAQHRPTTACTRHTSCAGEADR